MLAEPASTDALARHAAPVSAFGESRAAEHRAVIRLVTEADRGLHHELGFANIVDYATQMLGLSDRQVRTFLQIGRALPRLPALDQALAEGRLPWTRARELLRVVTPEDEAEWVAFACVATNRELEDVITARQSGVTHVGELPKAPERTRMVLHLATTDAEVLRAAIQWMRSRCGGDTEDVDDGALLALMAQRLIHDADEGTAPTAERYRIVVEQCPTCHRVEGVDAALTDTVLQEAACDAEIVDLRPGPNRGHLAHSIPPATRRAVLHRDRHRCRVPGCRNLVWLDLHHVVPRSRCGGHGEGNVITLCTTHHTLLHEGRLGIENVGGGFRFSFSNGRVVDVPFDERRRRIGGPRSDERQARAPVCDGIHAPSMGGVSPSS